MYDLEDSVLFVLMQLMRDKDTLEYFQQNHCRMVKLTHMQNNKKSEGI